MSILFVKYSETIFLIRSKVIYKNNKLLQCNTINPPFGRPFLQDHPLTGYLSYSGLSAWYFKAFSKATLLKLRLYILASLLELLIWSSVCYFDKLMLSKHKKLNG